MDSDFEVSEMTYSNFTEYYNSKSFIGDYDISFGSLKETVIQSSSIDQHVSEYKIDEFFLKYN